MVPAGAGGDETPEDYYNDDEEEEKTPNQPSSGILPVQTYGNQLLRQPIVSHQRGDWNAEPGESGSTE